MLFHLTTIGAIHTVISLVALGCALISLIRDGAILPTNPTGKAYVILTVTASLLAFGVMKTGHLSVAHALTALVLLCVGVGVFAHKIPAIKHLQTLALSTSLLLSLVPATVETFTRLPVDAPLASGPDSPIIQTSLGVLFLLYIAGVSYQIWQARKRQAH
jgi:hypothetical protein